VDVRGFTGSNPCDGNRLSTGRKRSDLRFPVRRDEHGPLARGRLVSTQNSFENRRGGIIVGEREQPLRDDLTQGFLGTVVDSRCFDFLPP
jgi:hypothetical protein